MRWSNRAMLRLLIVNTLVEVKGMRTDYKVLGDYIQLVDQRNRDLSVTRLLGVSIEKRFIPSIANIVGTDLSSYKIVRTGQFAYGPVTSRNGEKISIAYLDGEDCIISRSYTVFEVAKKDELDSEYLMLWFSRPEFDRYARYKSHGSVREIFDWNELCAVELPIPSIDKQRNIVKAYKTITNRITLKKLINDNLADTIDAIFINLYQNIDEESAVPFCNLCSLASSKRVFAEDYVSEGVPFYRGKEITQKRNGEPINDPLYITTEHYKTLKKKYGVPACGDILITAVGTIGNSYLVQEEDFYFKDGNIIWLKDFRDLGLNHYLYDYMQTSIFKRDLEGICIGSTQTALTIVALSNLKVKIPSQTLLSEYCKKSKVIRSNIQANNAEILRLTLVAQSILASLSR